MATHSHTQPPVIIVGGGLSGLSAAAYLAQAGHAVMLFEKASTPGGRARTRQQNGFFFNQGAHISTYTHVPDLLSAGLALSLLTSQGVLYLDGGWQTLVEGLRPKAQEARARLITQARVKAIEVTGEGYRVRLAGGSREVASAVWLATDPETASALVLDGTHEPLRS